MPPDSGIRFQNTVSQICIYSNKWSEIVCSSGIAFSNCKYTNSFIKEPYKKYVTMTTNCTMPQAVGNNSSLDSIIATRSSANCLAPFDVIHYAY